MHISEVQAYAQAQIAADPTLAALGTALIYTDFTEDEVARTQIEKSLRAYGVCFEIGAVEASGDGSKPANRYTLLDGRFDVYVAESPTQTHTPSEMSLVSQVATAIQARTANAPGIRCTGYGAAKSENGYVLRILSFSVPVLL
jgi:hypothetical protein